jgi:hypothetical protein
MAKLGYKINDFAELEPTFEEISEEKPGVNLKISYREYKGQEYQQADIVSLCDNDVVQEYKDEVAY